MLEQGALFVLVDKWVLPTVNYSFDQLCCKMINTHFWASNIFPVYHFQGLKPHHPARLESVLHAESERLSCWRGHIIFVRSWRCQAIILESDIFNIETSLWRRVYASFLSLIFWVSWKQRHLATCLRGHKIWIF